MAQEVVKNPQNTMEIGGGQAHTQGAGAGEFIGGKLTYIKCTTANLTAANGPDGSLAKIAEYIAQRSTIVVLNANSDSVDIIVEANSGIGTAAEVTAGTHAVGPAEIAAALTTVTAATVVDGLDLA
jgi:hypothetical protein